MGGPELIAAQAAMQLIEGGMERAGLREEARVLDANARIEETQGAYDAVQAMRESRMAAGADMADAAASGVGLGGSIAEIFTSQAVEREMEAMSLRAEAGMRASALRTEAKGRRKAGDRALIGGMLRAGASAIRGFGAQGADARVTAAEAGARRQALGSIPIPRRSDWSTGWSF